MRAMAQGLCAWVGSGRRSLRTGIRGARRDERGVAAIEFAFILPIFLLLLTGIIQIGGLMFLHSNMGNVARDVVRRVAVGEMSAASAPSYAQGRLLNFGGTYDVTVDMPDPAVPTDADITVQISVPMADVSLIDISGAFQTGNLSACATMRQE